MMIELDQLGYRPFYNDLSSGSELTAHNQKALCKNHFKSYLLPNMIEK